jgi:hypothetical protein
MGEIQMGSRGGVSVTDETITLREAASRLARIRNPKGTGIESSKLLNVLRSGHLNAGFYFLDGTAWIEIPLSYWRSIGGEKFRQIARNPDDPSSGTYKIRAATFPDQIADIICKAIEEKMTTVGEHKAGAMRVPVTAVVSAAAKSYEVLIKSAEFIDYLRRNELQETATTSNVGAPRKEGWRDICSYMAAYMTAHQRGLPEVRMKIEETSDEIFRLATADGVKDLPSAGTIKEELSKAIKLLKRADFQLKK